MAIRLNGRPGDTSYRYISVLCFLAVSFTTSCAQVTPKSSTPFEVVSISRVDRIESYPNTIYWDASRDVTGLVILLKRKPQAPNVIFSTDFSIAFGNNDSDPAEIPRRPAVGLSSGMKSATEAPNWNAGGGVSREMLNRDQPYFAVLFEAPKKVHEFTLNFATPVLKKLKETTGTAVKAQAAR